MKNFRSIDEAISELRNICSTEISKKEMDEFNEVLNFIKQMGYNENSKVNFALTNDINYYSGVAFKGYVMGIPSGIISGGQYDNLMEKMGRTSNAIGFAVYLNELKRLGSSKSEYDVDILLLHGGGGTAYYEWVKRWNEKGFVALAIDLEGHVPLKSGNLTSYPAELYTKSKYDAPNNVNLNDGNKEIEQTWLYYATKTAIIGNSFLHSLEEVNSQKIGLCGISWGGYISSIISGYDDRFDFVIPIYCLLGMEESGTPIGSYVTQNPKFRVFDDITPITLVDTPIHFVISSKDQHENIFNASEICGLTKNGTLSIIQNFPHSHFDAVNQIDPYEFALREINNETNIKVEISNNKVNIIGDINKVTSIELFEADEENISANTTYYSTSLDVAKENELILDDNTTYYYVSIHDVKNVVISSKVFKK